MLINIKNLTGKLETIEINENDKMYKFQAIYSYQSNISFEQLKFIYNGKSLLTFNTFFKSLKDLNITENTTVHLILRLGGPQPEERAVFQYFGKLMSGLEVPTLESLQRLFSTENAHRIGIECPVCLQYCVNRVLSCEHGICIECFNLLKEKRCPICRSFPVAIL